MTETVLFIFILFVLSRSISRVFFMSSCVDFKDLCSSYTQWKKKKNGLNKKNISGKAEVHLPQAHVFKVGKHKKYIKQDGRSVIC